MLLTRRWPTKLRGCGASRRRIVGIGVAALVPVVVVVATAAQASRRVVDDCTPSQMRLSVFDPGMGFTGGSYGVSLNLRNVSRSECSVEGHPTVIVSPHPFLIAVGDLADFDRNDPNLGPERVLHVQPGSSVHAQVVIGRRCDGAKREMVRTTITFSSYERNVPLQIDACRRAGATIDTGPYLSTP